MIEETVPAMAAERAALDAAAGAVMRDAVAVSGKLLKEWTFRFGGASVRMGAEQAGLQAGANWVTGQGGTVSRSRWRSPKALRRGWEGTWQEPG